MAEFPPGVDVQRPNVARVYDCFLGGTDNFAADREVFARVVSIAPESMRAAMAHRAFLRRVVRFLVIEAGISQFLDIGSGLPTRGNVHQAALEARAGSRVVYVDKDPEVVAHSRALLGESGTATAIAGDLRQPQQILDNPEVRKLLDSGQPVALTLLAVLHHISDDKDPAGITAALCNSLPPGSYLAVSHFCDTGPAAPWDSGWSIAETQKIFEESLGSGVWRSYQEILGYFRDLELIEPGLVPLAEWRPTPGRTSGQRIGYQSFVGGVARKE